MPVKRFTDYLDREGVPYEIRPHSPAVTAQEKAASAHVPGRELAKTVIVKLDGKPAMAVLPAFYLVDLDLLKVAAGARKAELAPAEELNRLFPDCDGGAMPPFGNLYGMPVFVAEVLTEDEQIAFNAGTHTELLRMAYSDFDRLVMPIVVKFAMRAARGG